MIRLFLIPLAIAVITSIIMTRISLARTRIALSKNSKVLQHPAIKAQTSRLAAVMDVEELTVLELNDDAVNGFADADGRIFLTKGFMHKFKTGAVSAEELASVIAHELGHVAHGHMKQRMRDVTGHQTAMMMANIMLSRFIPFIGPWLMARIAQAFMASTSRKNEFEADAWASALLIKAGIEPSRKNLFSANWAV